MGSLSGILQRPVIAASAVAIDSVSADFHEKLQPFGSSDARSSIEQSSSLINEALPDTKTSWVSQISVSKLADLSFVTRTRVPVPDVQKIVPNINQCFVPNFTCSSLVVTPALVNIYQSAALVKSAKPSTHTYSLPSSQPDVMYKWHLPEPDTVNVANNSENSDCASAKSRTVVVLLGWLGAKQKHLKKYAEWYTSQGFHAITFTFPMAEILSYQVGGKAERDVELLAEHLSDWLEEEHGKNLVFHTFSNTGWLTYGVILEKLQKEDPTLVGKIKGCIVDSAPVAAPNPQVWASGFSAAFLKKSSVATKGFVSTSDLETEKAVGKKTVVEPKPAVTESALMMVLEKFFDVVLNLPTVNRRLSDVVYMLTSHQPSCPQLYIYSSADKVIPAASVESFIEEQRRSGRMVKACNFVSTPHVDHFRNRPQLYTSQLSEFLEDYVLTSCKHSS